MRCSPPPPPRERARPRHLGIGVFGAASRPVVRADLDTVVVLVALGAEPGERGLKGIPPPGSVFGEHPRLGRELRGVVDHRLLPDGRYVAAQVEFESNV